MSDTPEFQYADGCFCFRTNEIEVHIDEMTFDEYLHAYLVKRGIDTRTQDELLGYVSLVGQQQLEAENVLHHVDYWRSLSDPRIRIIHKETSEEKTCDFDHAKEIYDTWYKRCLEVLADDEHYRYEHPSEEIRLELLRLPSLEEDDPEDATEKMVPCLSVTLEVFYHDPLLSVYLGMWTQNPAAMAMFFTGLELMDREVNVS